MKMFWNKKQENEDEEIVELTPEEKKEKVKKTVIGAAKAGCMMAVGAGVAFMTLLGIGMKTAKNSEESDDEVVEDVPCDEETVETTSEE